MSDVFTRSELNKVDDKYVRKLGPCPLCGQDAQAFNYRAAPYSNGREFLVALACRACGMNTGRTKSLQKLRDKVDEWNSASKSRWE